MTTGVTREQSDRYVEVEGIRIHYNEAGSGPALLGFHGGGPGANGWDNTRFNIDALAQQFRVLLVDLPGYGLSAKEFPIREEPRDVFYARIVRGLLDALGIQRAHLYASSMSGYMGMRFGIEYPERLGKLVLQAAGPRRDPVLSPRPLEGIKALRAFEDDPTWENMERMMRLFIPTEALCTREMIEARFRAATLPGHLEALRAMRAMPSSDLGRDIHRLRAPTLVLWGANDRMVPLDESLAALWLIPDVRLHVWGGATGHFVQYEKREEFNRLVTEFLTT